MTEGTPYLTTPQTPAQRAVAEHLRLLTSNDLDAWADLYTPDAIFTFPFAPAGMGTEVQGRKALLQHMRNFAATFDVEATKLRFVETASPETTVALWTLDGTAMPTGRSFVQDCLGIVSLDAAGLITRYDDYWNPLAAIEALQAEGTGDGGVAGSFGS